MNQNVSKTSAARPRHIPESNVNPLGMLGLGGAGLWCQAEPFVKPAELSPASLSPSQQRTAVHAWTQEALSGETEGLPFPCITQLLTHGSASPTPMPHHVWLPAQGRRPGHPRVRGNQQSSSLAAGLAPEPAGRLLVQTWCRKEDCLRGLAGSNSSAQENEAARPSGRHTAPRMHFGGAAVPIPGPLQRCKRGCHRMPGQQLPPSVAGTGITSPWQPPPLLQSWQAHAPGLTAAAARSVGRPGKRTPTSRDGAQWQSNPVWGGCPMQEQGGWWDRLLDLFPAQAPPQKAA